MADRNTGRKSLPFYTSALVCVLTVVALIFFGLSYTTGYVGIVFGEKNSLCTLAAQIVVLVLSGAVVLFQGKKPQMRNGLCHVLMLAITVLLTCALMLLLVDRVDAIGNCIVAPWDAGHGGEDSCYLSFVSMGCFLISLIANLAASFRGCDRT